MYLMKKFYLQEYYAYTIINCGEAVYNEWMGARDVDARDMDRGIGMECKCIFEKMVCTKGLNIHHGICM